MKKISVLESYDVFTKERVVLHEFDGVIEAPNWLSDGKTILFNSNGKLYKFDMENQVTSQVDTGACDKCNNDHVLSPGNDRIGISCRSEENGENVSRIYILPISGGTPEMVVKKGPSYLHGWSYDGKKLAYCAFRDDKVDIYTCVLGEDTEERLTDGLGYNDGPEYDPKDEHIWFNSTRNGLMQIFRMECDGRNMEQMTHQNSNNWFPHISPDREKVVYLSFCKEDLEPWQHVQDKNVSLWIMDYNGKNKQEIVKLFGGQGTINVNSWSPDSRKIAFVSYKYI